jgi:aminoglycoside phosphotransferase family enzyme/predicted kinase
MFQCHAKCQAAKRLDDRMSTMGEIHQQLLEPATYSEATRSVAFAETHISRVYLTDTTVYKFKKPLNLGFLDFSTLSKRHHFCKEEVRLNRRFTEGIYLGVVALRNRHGKLCFAGTGKILDYAVHMRRLPEQRMLNRLIAEESPGLAQQMPALGTALHAVFKRAEVCRTQTFSNADSVRQNCTENFRQTGPAIANVLEPEAHRLMQQATHRDLADLAELMHAREVSGFVRDGHGDLHTANICMTEPVCIYDCIEFNRRFRVADIIADLAFLIMDLEYLGRWDLAELLVNDYLDRSGDHEARLLLPFYKGYRAWVRGKVDAMLANESEVSGSTRSHAAILARRYFNLALGYLLQPTLFLTCGLMGVGKTTFARALAGATGARLLRSDVVRKQLAGLPAEQACPDAFGAGLYSAERTRITYDELFQDTVRHLSQGKSVIVDASFSRQEERQKFLNMAEQKGCPAWLMHLECPVDKALTRLEARTGDASDGRRELYLTQRAEFDGTRSNGTVVSIDTARPVDYNVQLMLCTALAERER